LLTTPGIRGFSLYSGTLDNYNSMKFYFRDGTTETTPTKLRDFVPKSSSGRRLTGQDRDGRMHVGFSKTLVGVEVSSSGNTFEISDFGASTVVPEPATWALMITGFGAAGAMLRRRRAVTA